VRNDGRDWIFCSTNAASSSGCDELFLLGHLLHGVASGYGEWLPRSKSENLAKQILCSLGLLEHTPVAVLRPAGEVLRQHGGRLTRG